MYFSFVAQSVSVFTVRESQSMFTRADIGRSVQASMSPTIIESDEIIRPKIRRAETALSCSHGDRKMTHNIRITNTVSLFVCCAVGF